MSYSRDLDEYDESELVEELRRRQRTRFYGACDYCGRSRTDTPCKFPHRHNLPEVDNKPKAPTFDGIARILPGNNPC